MILQIASIEEDMGKRKKISFQYVSFCILKNLYCKHVFSKNSPEHYSN